MSYKKGGGESGRGQNCSGCVRGKGCEPDMWRERTVNRWGVLTSLRLTGGGKKRYAKEGRTTETDTFLSRKSGGGREEERVPKKGGRGSDKSGETELRTSSGGGCSG